jgi:hypothetical protein
MNGDVGAGQLVKKLIAGRGVMLGLHAPQEAVLRIVEEARPKETSTDRIEAALNAPATTGSPTPLYHWARVAVQHDQRSRVKYAALRCRGHSHGRALRSVADRLLNVARAMLKTGTTFNPSLAAQKTC